MGIGRGDGGRRGGGVGVSGRSEPGRSVGAYQVIAIADSL